MILKFIDGAKPPQSLLCSSLKLYYSIFSCDVGLGEAVDTEPPSV